MLNCSKTSYCRGIALELEGPKETLVVGVRPVSNPMIAMALQRLLKRVHLAEGGQRSQSFDRGFANGDLEETRRSTSANCMQEGGKAALASVHFLLLCEREVRTFCASSIEASNSQRIVDFARAAVACSIAKPAIGQCLIKVWQHYIRDIPVFQAFELEDSLHATYVDSRPAASYRPAIASL